MPAQLIRTANLVGLVLLAPAIAFSQEPYRQPPAPIAQILDAAPIPAARISPDRSWLLLLERPSLPPIAEVAAPELHLAGERINPRTSGPSREISFAGLRLVAVSGGATRSIDTQPESRVGNVMWSPDGSRIAFTSTSNEGIALWVAEVATGKSRQVTKPILNATTGSPWAGISIQAG
jgi:Tol biopolymer transport system component